MTFISGHTLLPQLCEALGIDGVGLRGIVIHCDVKEWAVVDLYTESMDAALAAKLTYTAAEHLRAKVKLNGMPAVMSPKPVRSRDLGFALQKAFGLEGQAIRSLTVRCFTDEVVKIDYSTYHDRNNDAALLEAARGLQVETVKAQTVPYDSQAGSLRICEKCDYVAAYDLNEPLKCKACGSEFIRKYRESEVRSAVNGLRAEAKEDAACADAVVPHYRFTKNTTVWKEKNCIPVEDSPLSGNPFVSLAPAPSNADSHCECGGNTANTPHSAWCPRAAKDGAP
jgi:hypothetical protein